MQPVGDSSLAGGCSDKYKVPLETIQNISIGCKLSFIQVTVKRIISIVQISRVLFVDNS